MPAIFFPDTTDAEALATLMAHCLPPSQVWTVESLRQGLSEGRLVALTAGAGQEAIGFILAELARDEGTILNFSVLQTDRRRGIGTALWEGLSRYLQACGVNRITLEVSRGNLPALNIYEKIGFKKIGIRKKYYNHIDGIGQDALVLEHHIRN